MKGLSDDRLFAHLMTAMTYYMYDDVSLSFLYNSFINISQLIYRSISR